jgi:hypothetical protein
MVQGGDFVNVRFLLINNMQTFEAGLVFEKKSGLLPGIRAKLSKQNRSGS